MEYHITLISPTDTLTAESISSLIKGGIQDSFSAVSSGFNAIVNSLSHKKTDVATPANIIERRLKDLNWKTFSEAYMLVPEGLDRNLMAFTQLLDVQGRWLIDNYKDVLLGLSDNLDQALAEMPVSIMDTKKKLEKHVQQQTRFFSDSRKSLGATTGSHRVIRTLLYSANDAARWYQLATTMNLPIDATVVGEWNGMLTDTAVKLTTYSDHVVMNQTPARVAQAQMISKLALEVASRADIISTLALLNMQCMSSATAFGKQVLGK